MAWSQAACLSIVAHAILMIYLALFFLSQRKQQHPEPVLNGEFTVDNLVDEFPKEALVAPVIVIPEAHVEETLIQSPPAIANLEADDSHELDSLPTLDLLHSGNLFGEDDRPLSQNRGTEFASGDAQERIAGWDGMIRRLRRNGLDIVIVFDSTGSMGGEIRQVKDQMRRIGESLLKLVPTTRIGLCTYRDRGDAYVVKGLPLTSQLSQIDEFLAEINANGGGDAPEAVDEGLRWAMENNRFRHGARKVILVFGDAPPHAERLDNCLSCAAGFRHRGGIVSTVTCRRPTQIPEFQHIAKFGDGEAFLTKDEQQIMRKLLVLVFGSKYQDEVLKAFGLIDKQNNSFRSKTRNFRRNRVRFPSS